MLLALFDMDPQTSQLLVGLATAIATIIGGRYTVKFITNDQTRRLVGIDQKGEAAEGVNLVALTGQIATVETKVAALETKVEAVEKGLAAHVAEDKVELTRLDKVKMDRPVQVEMVQPVAGTPILVPKPA